MFPSSKSPPPPYLGIFWFVVPLPGEKFLMTFNISFGWEGGGCDKSTKLELNCAHFPRFSHTIYEQFFGSVVPHPFFQIRPPRADFRFFECWKTKGVDFGIFKPNLVQIWKLSWQKYYFFQGSFLWFLSSLKPKIDPWGVLFINKVGYHLNKKCLFML